MNVVRSLLWVSDATAGWEKVQQGEEMATPSQKKAVSSKVGPLNTLS